MYGRFNRAAPRAGKECATAWTGCSKTCQWENNCHHPPGNCSFFLQINFRPATLCWIEGAASSSYVESIHLTTTALYCGLLIKFAGTFFMVPVYNVPMSHSFEPSFPSFDSVVDSAQTIFLRRVSVQYHSYMFLSGFIPFLGDFESETLPKFKRLLFLANRRETENLSDLNWNSHNSLRQN